MSLLYDAFLKKNMEMLEINPLIVTDGGDLKVLDAKVSFDGNKNEMMARTRRPENKEALANV